MLDEKILQNARQIHFIGIGGSGMFPLVQIMQQRGYKITGSDNNESDTLALERAMGIDVMLGQRAENIAGADLIVYTAAIMDDNPELRAAFASKRRLLNAQSCLAFSPGFTRIVFVSAARMAKQRQPQCLHKCCSAQDSTQLLSSAGSCPPSVETAAPAKAA